MKRDFTDFCVLSIFFLTILCSVVHNVNAEGVDGSSALSAVGTVKTDDNAPVVSDENAEGKKGPCCETNPVEVNNNANFNISEYQELPEIPDILMVNQDGYTMRISEVLRDKITVINFIYTSCTSVCQILTSNFRQLETTLDSIDKNNEVQLISISIDPGTDTPDRLRQYADKQRIDLSRWTLLVSGTNSIERFSRSLGFSNIDKSTHAPGVVIWDDIDKRWQRFVGITPPYIISKEIVKLLAING